MAAFVPVYRPRLPTADAIEPYLRRIDAARQYSNRGPLVWAFERRLDRLLGGEAAHVVTAASGTAALQAAILATAGVAGGARPLAMMPSYTFVATAFAAGQCGFRPYFVDVDADSWALDPGRLHDHPRLDETGVLVVVAPYGRLPDVAAWARFARETGIAVVIDAAAAVEALGRRAEADPAGAIDVPVVVSLHATKPLACGEGGCVLWSDRGGLERVARALNFGFLGSRSAMSAGFNGKLSEYHAAVGLAALDAWPERCQAIERLYARLSEGARRRGIADRLKTFPDISSCYLLYDAGEGADPAAQAVAMARHLAGRGLEHRFWYGSGVHREPWFVSSAGADDLPATQALASRLLGIPVHAPDGARDEPMVDLVLDAVEQAS